MPEYVTAYSESVIVEYRQLGPAAKRAVRRALASDGSYRQCTADREQTDVMALFSHIEDRWQALGSEWNEHTYLRHESGYFGVQIVHEGDQVMVDSIPCTEEECPTTPTPPS